MRKVLLIVFIVFCIFQMVVLATAIDIGTPAIDRGDYSSANYTFVAKGNPADGTGTITSVEIWAKTELAGCEVATFSASGNSLTSRDSEVVDNGNGAGVVIAGSKQTFTVSLDVQTEDYLGITYTGGTLEMELSGGDGYWYKSGDYIPCISEAFSVSADRIQSIYGTGATALTFALVKFNDVTVTKWNELAITKWNNKNIP